MGLNLTTQFIDETFKGLLQVSGSDQVTDGTGSLITNLDIQASTAVSSSFATSASYAVTASHALNAGDWDGQYSGSAGITGSLNVALEGLGDGVYVSSSFANARLIDRALTIEGDSAALILRGQVNTAVILDSQNDTYIQKQGAGDFYFDNNVGDTILEGSGSVIVNQPLEANGGVTGSLFGTASHAVTASYALNAGGGAGFPYTGSAGISGSLTVQGPITSETFGTISLTGDSPGINRNILDFTGADFSVIRSDSGLEIDTRAGSGSVSVYTNGNMQFEPQGDLDFYTPSGSINLTAADANFTVNDGGINFNLTNGDNTSNVDFIKGLSNFNFNIFQAPGFTGSFLSVNNVDEFKITGDVPLAIDNQGFGGTNDVSLRASRDVRLEADDDIIVEASDTITFTANTSQSFQGIDFNARNVRINLTETGSDFGQFTLRAPGFTSNTPGMFLTLTTGSYGSNPTVSNMIFQGEDSFFSAVGNFYIKNVFNDTGSLTVWSENELTLRGDTEITIEGDTFANPNDPINININGTTFMDSFTSGIMAFQPQIGKYTRVGQFQRAFVETPLVINGGGTVEVQTGATLKVINEL